MTTAENISATIRRFLDGDRDAFNVLLETIKPRIWQLIIHKVPYQEADDIFQEACTSIFTQLATLEEPERFVVWSIRIAQRRIHDHFRRHYRALPTDSLDEQEDYLQVSAPFSAEKRLYIKRLRRAIRSLEEPYREVSILHFIVGLSMPEIANLNGKPINTIKSYILRAKPLIFQAFERSQHDQ